MMIKLSKTDSFIIFYGVHAYLIIGDIKWTKLKIELLKWLMSF